MFSFRRIKRWWSKRIVLDRQSYNESVLNRSQNSARSAMILVDQFLREHKKEKAERTHLSKKLCLALLGTDLLDMVKLRNANRIPDSSGLPFTGISTWTTGELFPISAALALAGARMIHASIGSFGKKRSSIKFSFWIFWYQPEGKNKLKWNRRTFLSNGITGCHGGINLRHRWKLRPCCKSKPIS